MDPINPKIFGKSGAADNLLLVFISSGQGVYKSSAIHPALGIVLSRPEILPFLEF
tara:strand:- start:21106 stop:21270 length:165 start_codon:yes stop_codon:yes gene_type:complete